MVSWSVSHCPARSNVDSPLLCTLRSKEVQEEGEDPSYAASSLCSVGRQLLNHSYITKDSCSGAIIFVFSPACNYPKCTLVRAPVFLSHCTYSCFYKMGQVIIQRVNPAKNLGLCPHKSKDSIPIPRKTAYSLNYQDLKDKTQ